jgi:membrane protein DedA with SNARE-associated domain
MHLMMIAVARIVGGGLATAGASGPGGVSGWLLHFHGTAAYALVGSLAFAEAALMVGFFIPGETAVVIGGVLAGLHQVNLGVMIAVVVVCAVVGDSVGFEVGKRSGPWLLERRPLRGNAGVRRTVAMLERYGGPAVFLGRFVAFARAIIPALAGMSGLRYRVFFFYNAAGGLIWGVGYTLLGFVVGISFEHILSTVGLWSLAVVAAVAVAVVGVHLVLKRRRGRPGTADVANASDASDGAGTADAAETTGTAGSAEASEGKVVSVWWSRKGAETGGEFDLDALRDSLRARREVTDPVDATEDGHSRPDPGSS